MSKKRKKWSEIYFEIKIHSYSSPGYQNWDSGLPKKDRRRESKDKKGSSSKAISSFYRNT